MYKWLWKALGWLALSIILPVLVIYGVMFSLSARFPNVEGLPEAEAVAAVEKAGLRPKLVYTTSREIPAGYAVNKNTMFPIRYWPNTEVAVRVSSGPRTYTMPELITMNYQDALSRLRGMGLIMRLAENSTMAGYLCFQSVEFGTEVAEGTEVTVAFCDGWQLGIMPDLCGLPVSQAAEAVQAHGLQFSATYVDSETAEDTVLRQEPLPGKLLGDTKTVRLQVSRGYIQPKKSALPNFVNMDYLDAAKMLDALGYTWELSFVDSEQKENTVTAQSPRPGTGILPGDKVVLKVSRGVVMVKVPDLSGVSLSSAEAMAKKQGFSLTVRYAYSTAATKDSVMQQTPAAGTEIGKGGAVTVTLCAGRGAVGNLTSNALNSGVVVSQGDWVYFTNYNSDFYIYKMRRDGSEKQLLLRDTAICLNLVGEWIYYNSMKKTNGVYDGLCKVRVDGTGWTQLRSGYYGWVFVEDDWIYFSENKFGSPICRVKTDGTRYSVVTDDNCICPVVTEAGILYVIEPDNDLYLVQKDGNGKKLRMSQAQIRHLAYDDGQLFGLRISDILRLDVATGQQSVLEAEGTEARHLLAASDGWLYYRKYPDVSEGWAGIYKIRSDLTGETKVCDLQNPTNTNAYLVVDGDWLYFPNGLDHNRLYRVKTDGSALERVCP